MEIDRTAPVRSSQEISIDAPMEDVWETLADIDRWSTWNPEIREAKIDGPLTPGTRFRWKSGPGRITSTLQVVERPHTLAWTGTTMGIKAVHVYRILPSDGGTLLRTEESWAGLIPRILPGWSRKTLDKALESGPRYLKAEVERRTSSW
jgi:uncharacterized protein YndB with AHSA1/START domain